MSPRAVGPTTVKFTAMALAAAGMPQLLASIGKILAAPVGDSAGPPSGPVAVRVSNTRQGARVKKPGVVVAAGSTTSANEAVWRAPLASVTVTARVQVCLLPSELEGAVQVGSASEALVKLPLPDAP